MEFIKLADFPVESETWDNHGICSSFLVGFPRKKCFDERCIHQFSSHVSSILSRQLVWWQSLILSHLFCVLVMHLWHFLTWKIQVRLSRKYRRAKLIHLLKEVTWKHWIRLKIKTLYIICHNFHGAGYFWKPRTEKFHKYVNVVWNSN